MLYFDETMELKAFLLFFYAIALFIAMQILGDSKLSKRMLKITYFLLGVITTVVLLLVITRNRYYFPFSGMI